MSYVQVDQEDVPCWRPRVVLVDEANHIVEVRRGLPDGLYELPGMDEC